MSPQVQPEDLRTLAADNVAFGLDLLHALGGKDNRIVSPHSISTAMAMTYAGARGATHDEMARAMHFTLPEPLLHAAFDAVNLAMETRASDAGSAGLRPFELNVANGLWVQSDMPLLTDFLDTMERYYGAGAWKLDFANDPTGARTAINAWVSDRTKSKIPELLPPGLPSPRSRLVLTNAIYFLGSWQSSFIAEYTRSTPFEKLDGSTVAAEMMTGAVANLYAEGPNWQAVELLYVPGSASMVLILPAAGEFNSFVASLDGPALQTILNGIKLKTVDDLRIPKFQVTEPLQLKSTLLGMGMKLAFGAADFSGMTGTTDLCIEEIAHQSVIRVDETGTEAGAATAVVMKDASVVLNPVTFIANRPFLFLVRDKATGTVLFLGQVTDPSS